MVVLCSIRLLTASILLSTCSTIVFDESLFDDDVEVGVAVDDVSLSVFTSASLRAVSSAFSLSSCSSFSPLLTSESI